MKVQKKFLSLVLVGISSAVLAATAMAGAHRSAQQQKDIVDTAVAAGSFSTLAAALEAADLIGALKADGPYTVFAPTDEAFAKLPAGTVEDLLKPENQEQLQAILLYHVVPDKIMAADIGMAVTLATLQGASIDVVSSSNGVTVNGARVVSADIAASNGVIHVIDAVILPPDGVSE